MATFLPKMATFLPAEVVNRTMRAPLGPYNATRWQLAWLRGKLDGKKKASEEASNQQKPKTKTVIMLELPS